MKNAILTSVLAAGVMSLGVAQAQAPEGSDAVFGTLDTNGDQQLSAAELTQLPQAMHQQMFDRQDSDHDGKIDKSEFMNRARQRAEKMFSRMDTNGDGALAPDEMGPPHRGDGQTAEHASSREGRHRHGKHHRKGHCRAHGGHHRRGMHGMPNTNKLFLRMDTDVNGFVSKDEWQTAAAKWHHGHDRAMPGHDESGHDE